MRKTVYLIMIAILALTMLAACGQQEEEQAEEPTSFELALVTDATGVNDGTFHQVTWNAMRKFGEENGMTCDYYAAEQDNETGYLDAIQEAKDKGAQLVVLGGSQFETAAYEAQKKYPDLYFVLLDGVPRDEDYNYKTAGNSTGVLFAEEQAGYLAGYAAVCEGYTKLGFIGGEALPPVKRYGYGFVQGAAAAVKERGGSDTKVKYTYTGTFAASDKIEKEASDWYEDGTEVIFACGGGIGESVMAAAEKTSGKVIGVDADQSGLSETVITSARKQTGKAVTDILKNYKRHNFEGGAILNYSAENNGIGLEMKNARLTVFDTETYKAIYQEIKNGDRQIEKDLGDKSVKSLVKGNDSVKVEVEGDE